MFKNCTDLAVNHNKTHLKSKNILILKKILTQSWANSSLPISKIHQSKQTNYSGKLVNNIQPFAQLCKWRDFQEIGSGEEWSPYYICREETKWSYRFASDSNFPLLSWRQNISIFVYNLEWKTTCSLVQWEKNPQIPNKPNKKLLWKNLKSSQQTWTS